MGVGEGRSDWSDWSHWNDWRTYTGWYSGGEGNMFWGKCSGESVCDIEDYEGDLVIQLIT